MKLHEYLDLSGALSVKELSVQIGVPSDAQVRQWQHGYANRKPGPKHCVAIERATRGLVTRADLRPDDWRDIWPELASAEAAHA